MRHCLSLWICTVLFSLVSVICYGAERRKYIEQSANNTHIAIFVHGFTGSYLETWGKLPEFLQEDTGLDSYDFLFWGYPSNFFHRNETIGTTGKYLKSEIDYLFKPYDKIALIGHSMGGLVIRSYIVQALLDGKGNDLKTIADVMLFGVPNEGLRTAEVIPKWVNAQIADLGVASKFITELRKYWVQRVTTAPSNDAFYRAIPTVAVAGYEDHFVNQESVESFFHDTAMTDGDHGSMVKPETTSHLTYRIIRQRLIALASRPPVSGEKKTSYPCEAEIVSLSGAQHVTVIRIRPGSSQPRESIEVGTKVRVISMSGDDDPWYRIQMHDGTVRGWIPKQYIRLSETCSR